MRPVLPGRFKMVMLLSRELSCQAPGIIRVVRTVH